MRSVLAALFLAFAAGAALAHDWNGIAIGADDALFVVDAEDGQVWRVDAKGKVTVHHEGVEDRKTCPHTHHVVLDGEGNLWLPSG